MYGLRVLFRRWTFGSLMLSLIGGSILLQAAPPAWWSDGNPPVIDPQATANNHGAANIGQAKWMAKSALEALRAKSPELAALVEADLVGESKPIASWATPVTPEQQAQQRQPLVLGQLKAIAAPFYDRLQTADPAWLAAQAIENGMPSTGSHYPWTATTSDDANKAMATVGQLKAVFSLRFENLILDPDADNDGLDDQWERDHRLDPADDGSTDPKNGAGGDPDGDLVNNLNEFTHHTDPRNKADSDNDGLWDDWEVCWFGNLTSQNGLSAPVFSYAEATSTRNFDVAIELNAPGAIIRYTTNGADPVVGDPIITAGSAVPMKRTTVLKAKAWLGNTVSAIAAQKFSVTGSIAAGDQHVLALKSNGQMFSWGRQKNGRLGNGLLTDVNVYTPTLVKQSASVTITDVVDCAGGATHSVFRDAAGNVWGFGTNSNGELGNSSSSTADQSYPVQVLKSTSAGDYLMGCKKVSAGSGFSAALSEDGKVYTWGSQEYGRLGNGVVNGKRSYADTVKSSESGNPELIGIRQIDLGDAFGLARMPHSSEVTGSNGEVWAWGRNNSGQLGNGTSINQAHASKVKLNAQTILTDVTDVSAGRFHAAIIRWKEGDANLQGSVWCMGARASALGDGGSTTTGPAAIYPVQVIKDDFTPLFGVVQVSAGITHTLAVDVNGNVWSWGNNSPYGALGNNSQTNVNYAVKVRGAANTFLENIVCVAAAGEGLNYSTALAGDGTLYAWGNNDYGQLSQVTSSSVNKLPLAATIATSSVPAATLEVQVNKETSLGQILLSSVVSDSDGTSNIQKLDFYLQGQLVGTRTSAPWHLSVSNLQAASYHSYAIITDQDGNASMSPPADFTIYVDADQDGLADSWEVQWFGDIYGQKGSDDFDHDGLTNAQEKSRGFVPTGSLNVDQDDLPDDWEIFYFGNTTTANRNGDTDEDGLSNYTELLIYTNPNAFDTDGDSLSDGSEYNQSGLDPLAYTNISGDVDSDGDGLSDLMEVFNGTDPTKIDTDGDGFDDQFELVQGTSPTDANKNIAKFASYFGPVIDDPSVGNLGVGSSRSNYWVEGSLGYAAWYYFSPESLESGNIDAVPYVFYPYGCKWEIRYNDKKVFMDLPSIIPPGPNQSWSVNYRLELESDSIYAVTLAPCQSVNLYLGDQISPWMVSFTPWGREVYLGSLSGFIRCVDPLRGPIYQNGELYNRTHQESWSPSVEYLVPVVPLGYSASFSGNEAVGPHYRKVSLQGIPISDANPSEQQKSDSSDEQTYVDAFNLSLHHDTSYVHVPIGGSDLSLAATASVQETRWSNRHGLRPHEELTSPFGIGWSSNLCAYVETVETLGSEGKEPITVNVVDETGRTQRFGTKGKDATGKQTFFAWPCSQVDQKTYLNTLKYEGQNLVLQKKYGNKLTYRPCKAWFMYAEDRVTMNDTAKKHVYWRLEEVEDRFGQKLIYDYGNSEVSLIPQEIRVASRPRQRILINRSTNGRRINSITDPNDKTTSFVYDDSFIRQPGTGVSGWAAVDNPYTKLVRVEYPNDEKAHYDYVVHADHELVGNTETYHYHANLSYLKNARGSEFGFEYQYDRTQKAYFEQASILAFGASISGMPANFQAIAQAQLDAANDARRVDNSAAYRTRYGIPRLIQRVTLPGGGDSEFAKTASSEVQYGPEFTASLGTVVTDALEQTYRYRFNGVNGHLVDTDARTVDGIITTAKEWMLYYTSMDLDYLGTDNTVLGTERFEFNVPSGFSLSRAVDFSGNETTWKYEAPYHPTGVASLTGNSDFMTAWADPTSKTDALDRTETYEYGNYRKLTKHVDVHGTETAYGVDSKGRRKSAIVTGSNGQKLHEELYVYADEDGDSSSNLPGFLVSKTRKAYALLSGMPWEQDLKVQFVPDAYGRVEREIVDPDGFALRTSYSYDLNNNKIGTLDPRNILTVFTYDDLNRLEKVTYGDTHFKEYFYNTKGEKFREQDEAGNSTLFEYDAFGRIAKQARDLDGNGEISAGDPIAQTTYNKLGLVTRSIDPRGNASLTFYDSLNRPSDVFQGVPEASSSNGLEQLQTLAANSRSITHDELFYENSANTGGGLLSAFRPTKTIRHNAVSSSLGEADVSLESRAVYDKIYRPVETSQEYAPGLSRVIRMAYGLPEDNEYESLIAEVTDSLGKVIRTKTDGLGRVTEVIDGFGLADPSLTKTGRTFYTSTGLPWRTIDPMDRHSEIEYDKAGRAVKSWLPDPVTGLVTGNSPRTQTLYDGNGNVTAVIDAEERRTDFEYDLRNRKWRTTAPAVTNAGDPDAPVSNVRPVAEMEYDAVGNPIAVKDVRGAITRTFYDRANRPEKVRSNPVSGAPSAVSDTLGPNDITVKTTYDPAGLILSVQDGNGNFTRNAYDSLGRLVATVTDPSSGNPADPATGGFEAAAYRSANPSSILVTNVYDDAGDLLEVTDGKGQKTAFTYDGFARKTRTIWDPGTAVEKVESSEFNDLLLTRRSDAGERVTVYGYDAQYRLTDVVYAPAEGETTSTHVDNRHYAYDLADKVLGVSYPNDPGSIRETACTYDKLDRLLTETSAGVTHSYPLYDKIGNRLQTVYGRTGRALVSTYDALNRLATCEERDTLGIPSGRVSTYAYDLNGKVTRKTLPNGNATTTRYDFLGRTTLIQEKTAAGALVASFDYSQAVTPWPSGYDAVGNVLRCEEAYSRTGMIGRVVENTYDHTYRLLTETATPSGQVATVTEYAYDKTNNRIGKTMAGSTTDYVYGDGTNGANSNQLLSYGSAGQPATCAFTYDAHGNRATRSVGAATDAYIWDFENRLTELQTTAGTYRYGYDARCRRVVRNESSAGGIHTVITFAGGSSVQEATVAGAVEAELIRGSDWGGGVGGILYAIRSGQRSYNAYNSRGDVVSTSDETGAASWQATYEAFGTRTTEEGTNTERQRANTKDEDPTGLLNEGFRYRDLESGTFISRDPAGFVDGPNVYTYVRQNPWSGFDPAGLATIMPTTQDDGELHTTLVDTPVAEAPEPTDRELEREKWGAEAQAAVDAQSARDQFRRSATERMEVMMLDRIGKGNPMSSDERQSMYYEFAKAATLLGDSQFTNSMWAQCRAAEASGRQAQYAEAAIEILTTVLTLVDPIPGDEALAMARTGSAANKLATGADEAVFWSGLGRGGDATAARWVAGNGGSTLETTLATRGVKLPVWDADNPASVAAWKQASVDFAAGARGNVRVLQGDSLRIDAIWVDEFKALKANPNVDSIRAINPQTGGEASLWSR
jgi:RHS repeat-associated protein